MISTKGRYALRVMIDLAENNTGDNIPLKDIAKRQEISQKYLESIVVVLSKAGFVFASHGKGGGYRLSKAPCDYTVGSILKLIEGSLAPVSCLDCSSNLNKTNTPCERAENCKTLPMWKKFYEMTDNFFENITIEDLVNSTSQANYII